MTYHSSACFRLRRSLLCLLLPTCLVCQACGGGIPLNEETVFQANPSITPATFDRERSELNNEFFGDDPRIHAWHIDRTPSRCTVLFFGGQRFHMVLSRLRVDSFLDRIPSNLFMFDYRGYGRSEGTPGVEGLKRDALDAYDYLTETLEAECVVAHGHSLGTFLATWVATERDVDGVVLEAPVVSAERFADELLPWYLDLFIGFDISPAFQGEDNGERVEALESPLLLVAGTEDDVAPPVHAKALDEASKAPWTQLVLVEGGSHNTLHRQDAFETAYRDLLCEMGRCSEGESDDDGS